MLPSVTEGLGRTWVDPVPGDDMGFRTATLISPADLRRPTLPWHARFAALAHKRGRLFFLHYCGNLAAIIPHLLDTVRIDGKDSFEDAILPAEWFHALYQERVTGDLALQSVVCRNGHRLDGLAGKQVTMRAVGPRYAKSIGDLSAEAGADLGRRGRFARLDEAEIGQVHLLRHEPSAHIADPKPCHSASQYRKHKGPGGLASTGALDSAFSRSRALALSLDTTQSNTLHNVPLHEEEDQEGRSEG